MRGCNEVEQEGRGKAWSQGPVDSCTRKGDSVKAGQGGSSWLGTGNYPRLYPA